MRRAPTPLWLASPSRYAGISSMAARGLLGVLAAIVAASLLTLLSPAITADTGPTALLAAVVDGMRHGGEYYPVTADALRSGGYPLRPFSAFPLPTLARIEAAVPAFAMLVLLSTLMVVTVVAWYARLRTVLRPLVALTAAVLLLAAGMRAEPTGSHALWAGLLIALSLARYRPRRAAEAIGWGLAAALIGEVAGLYLLLMAVFAWRDGDRREAIGWGAAILVLTVVVALHAHAGSQVVRPLDLATPSWSGPPGPGFVVRAAWAATALSAVPLGLAAPLIAVALFGWTAWRDPLALRAIATIVAYALLLGMVARPDTAWTLLTAPLLLLGLAFAPDGLRDLWVAALDRRRITVTRVTS